MQLPETVKDSPIYATAALSFLGVSLSDWVLILAVLYGAARVILVAFEFYWKWKDRRNGIHRH